MNAKKELVGKMESQAARVKKDVTATKKRGKYPANGTLARDLDDMLIRAANLSKVAKFVALLPDNHKMFRKLECVAANSNCGKVLELYVDSFVGYWGCRKEGDACHSGFRFVAEMDKCMFRALNKCLEYMYVFNEREEFSQGEFEAFLEDTGCIDEIECELEELYGYQE